MWLSPEQLMRLTGCRQFAAQRRWLDVHRWHYEEAATGEPLVLASYAESRQPKGWPKRRGRPHLHAVS